MYSMSRPWERRLSILPKLVFPTISDALFRLIPTTSAICSWVQPRRFNRMIMISRPALCRAQISEIQELTVCCITPNFCARASCAHLHSGSGPGPALERHCLNTLWSLQDFAGKGSHSCLAYQPALARLASKTLLPL